MTTTKSPQSRCGENTGLFFPLRVEAITLARRPTVLSVASTMCHRRAPSRVPLEIVLVSFFISSLSVSLEEVAGPTRLELATSGVTGRRSNQLNYDPTMGGIRFERMALGLQGRCSSAELTAL